MERKRAADTHRRTWWMCATNSTMETTATMAYSARRSLEVARVQNKLWESMANSFGEQLAARGGWEIGRKLNADKRYCRATGGGRDRLPLPNFRAQVRELEPLHAVGAAFPRSIAASSRM